mgnify:CR=1 FL=1
MDFSLGTLLGQIGALVFFLALLLGFSWLLVLAIQNLRSGNAGKN